jgi:hypothetical protein
LGAANGDFHYVGFPGLLHFNIADWNLSQVLALYSQQPDCACTGGHLTEPKEQKTQQSSGRGRSSALQLLHS